MEILRKTLWCDWDKTLDCYKELTNCTILIAEKLDCYWPNQLVDQFFITIHRHYFKNCPVSGRAKNVYSVGLMEQSLNQQKLRKRSQADEEGKKEANTEWLHS
ncbi:receptor activity-modifying protein 1 [Crotalus adamanteus]|uniref:Receptor activity-modifying protein 1 n=1 Tax=Crotalus adamanteus TaxID=8729 RepID=A0AAW1CB57_CROAD